MTRVEFNTAYREARLTLKFMAAMSWTQHRSRYITRDERQQAEARWISWQTMPWMGPAMKAVGDRCYIFGSISNGALHDLRHCGGRRRSWYLRMAHDKRARGAA